MAAAREALNNAPIAMPEEALDFACRAYHQHVAAPYRAKRIAALRAEAENIRAEALDLGRNAFLNAAKLNQQANELERGG